MERPAGASVAHVPACHLHGSSHQENEKCKDSPALSVAFLARPGLLPGRVLCEIIIQFKHALRPA